MLSHRTAQANETAAYNSMWRRFGSWEAIRDAPVEALAETIRLANFADAKAVNIKKTRSIIIAERGQTSIDFLRDLPAAEGLAWLTALPGVGIKTASFVLLFCFAKLVMPADTQVHCVSQRLGLIGPRVTLRPPIRSYCRCYRPTLPSFSTSTSTCSGMGSKSACGACCAARAAP